MGRPGSHILSWPPTPTRTRSLRSELSAVDLERGSGRAARGTDRPGRGVDREAAVRIEAERGHGGADRADRDARGDVGKVAALNELGIPATELRHRLNRPVGPPAAAGAPSDGVPLVNDSTTWRLRRTASAWARRTPFCSASATVRTRALLIQIENDGRLS